MKQPFIATFASLIALSVAAPAMAQSYDGGRSERANQGDGGSEQQAGQSRVEVSPYIEASQVLVAELSPGNDVLTYTQVAAGVDVSVNGRNNGGSVSLRYERQFAGSDNLADSSTVSGVARGYATIIPQALTIEAGGLAAHTQIEGNGGTSPNPVVQSDSESQIYSVYAGPNLHTSAGIAEINANYRIGYTRVEAPDALVTAPGAEPVDVFDDSVVQNAAVHIGTQAGNGLPVGLGVGAGWTQEDVSNLDQRVRDAYARADVSVPLGQSVALVGGLGYEDVEVSSRDAVVDANGDPVIDGNGRFVTDSAVPRQIAYEAEGLIWDVGVIWRPSSRTAFEAHVGRRYDSTTYYGSFAYAASSRSSFNVSVYDNLSGFGGQLNSALVNLPSQFQANRSAVSGDATGCVASEEGGNCLNGALGSVRSAVFRSRGVAASYSHQLGNVSAGIGAGYDRRRFIAGENTALAAANGVVDESYYVAAYISAQLDQNSTISANTYANWTESGFVNTGGTSSYGASAAFREQIYRGLSASAAFAIDSFSSDITLDDVTATSALLGLRYDF